MRVVFDPASLHQSSRGAITAVVYFDFGADQQFPVAGWNDFVVVVAGWWLAGLQELAGASSEVKLRFMDGPYWITVTRQDSDTVCLRCTEDRSGADAPGEFVTSWKEFSTEVRSLADDVLQSCANQGFQSPDLQKLRPARPGS